MAAIYRLTLRQLMGPWRLVIMTVLAALPILISTLTLRSSSTPDVAEFEIVVFSAMLAGSIAPLVVLAIAAAAFGNELDDRTLANLTLSPLPRWKIALPKLLAVITVAAPFIALSAGISAHVAFLGDAAATTAITVSAIAGVAMYASAFVWLGLVTSYAVGFGLLYIVLWEGFFSGFVSGIRLFSIRHYTIDLMHVLDARRFADIPHMGSGLAIAVAVLVVVGFLFLTVRRLRRMDVP